MSEPSRVIVEILVAAPIETVWKTLREPAEICRWFGWDYPKLAEEVEVMFVQGVQADEANHVLFADGMPDRFQLEPHGAHTIVRLIRSAPVTDAGWQGIYEESTEGWLTFLQQLRFAIDRHPGADRRTVYLNGRARTAGTPQPAEALGFSKLSVVPVGDRYETTTPTGEGLDGTVFYRTANQLGLTVDGYGDGLVVVNARPRTTKSAHGGGAVIVTTYGLDDRAFAGVTDRWTKWWRDTYEVIEIQP
jgi:hypothetical protein